MTLFVILAMVLLLTYAAWQTKRNGWIDFADGEEGKWEVAVLREGASETYHEDTFPYDADEAFALEEASLEELEDEAASYAVFVAMDLHQRGLLQETDTIVVTCDDAFGTFIFHPDFKESILVGVKESEIATPAN